MMAFAEKKLAKEQPDWINAQHQVFIGKQSFEIKPDLTLSFFVTFTPSNTRNI